MPTYTNTIPTTGTARSDMGAGSLTAGGFIDGLLKDVYLPGVTNTVYDDPSFMGLIAQGMGTVDATGRKLIHAFETQRAGGFGAIAEGGDFRTNVPIDGVQGGEWIKYLNLYFELTGPAQATISQGEGSYVDIVERHVSSIARTAKNQAERIFTGSGNAALGIVSSITTGAVTTAYVEVTGPAFFDTQHFQKGLPINFATQSLTGTSTIVTIADHDNTVRDCTVSSFTKGSKRAGTKGRVYLSVASDGNADIAAGDIICLKDSYGWGTATGATASYSSCLEPNGLMNLVSDGVSNSETSGFYTQNWGLDRSADTPANEFLQSHMYNAASQELDEELMLEAIMENQALYQGNPNLLLVSARAMLKYFINSKEDRRFNTMDAMAWTGGYSGMGIQLGSKRLMLTTVNSAPTGYAFLINTNDFKFLRPPGMSGFKWLTGEGGGVLTQKHASDNKFAAAVDYVQMVCFDPGRQTKIYGIAE